MRKEKISGWGNYPVLECEIARIKNPEQLKKKLHSEKAITARGLGRSYGDQSISSDALVTELPAMNKILSFDDTSGILNCQAGLSLQQIIKIFAPRGWFPMINPGTKYVTVGGAIANDIHGKAHHVDGSFINCVENFDILLASGEIKSCSRNENIDLFYANFGGLGLLGIIIRASLKLKKIETTYFVQKVIKCKNIEDMLDAFDQYDKEYDYSVAWVNALVRGKNLGQGVLTLGNQASLNDLPKKLQKDPLFVSPEAKLKVPFYLPSFFLNSISVILLNKFIAYVQAKPTTIVHYEKFFFPLDAILNWNRGYGKRGFIQYQFVIPLENGRENIKKLLSAVSQSGCTPFLNVLKKFGDGQQYLSFPKPGYTFAIDFPVTKKLPGFISRLDQMVLDCGGRIYLGKDAMLTADTFEKMYPEYQQWLAIKKKYDPHNKFSSALAHRLKLLI
ncbi:MAG: FAD-binding protein [Cyclobacteriaceae bacterium]